MQQHSFQSPVVHDHNVARALVSTNTLAKGLASRDCSSPLHRKEWAADLYHQHAGNSRRPQFLNGTPSPRWWDHLLLVRSIRDRAICLDSEER